MYSRLAAVLVLALASCAGGDPIGSSAIDDDAKLPAALTTADFTQPLDETSIRALQTWLTDDQFAAKWATMLVTPVDLLGGADSAWYADLGALPASRLPGVQVLCHGDAKLDNFGWVEIAGNTVFSDSDFDDADFCPVAADALRYLVATDLWFASSKLDGEALDAYVAGVGGNSGITKIEKSLAPSWSKINSKGLAKYVADDRFILAGEVQAATADEIAAVRALAASDPRFPPAVLDVARDVRVDGGSAGLRRWWLLTADATGAQTIIELKEMGVPGPTFGRQTDTLDGDDRMAVLKQLWWGSTDDADEFQLAFLGGEFVVRNRLIRENADPGGLSNDDLKNLIEAEASLLGAKHRAAWGSTKSSKLSAWLQTSAATLSARWRAAYAAAGGTGTSGD